MNKPASKLVVEDLHLQYGDNKILQGVSMTLNPGELFQGSRRGGDDVRGQRAQQLGRRLGHVGQRGAFVDLDAQQPGCFAPQVQGVG